MKSFSVQTSETLTCVTASLWKLARPPGSHDPLQRRLTHEQTLRVPDVCGVKLQTTQSLRFLKIWCIWSCRCAERKPSVLQVFTGSSSQHMNATQTHTHTHTHTHTLRRAHVGHTEILTHCFHWASFSRTVEVSDTVTFILLQMCAYNTHTHTHTHTHTLYIWSYKPSAVQRGKALHQSAACQAGQMWRHWALSHSWQRQTDKSDSWSCCQPRICRFLYFNSPIYTIYMLDRISAFCQRCVTARSSSWFMSLKFKVPPCFSFWTVDQITGGRENNLTVSLLLCFLVVVVTVHVFHRAALKLWFVDLRGPTATGRTSRNNAAITPPRGRAAARDVGCRIYKTDKKNKKRLPTFFLLSVLSVVSSAGRHLVVS